jgi:Icc-related predicted phosphoesterase
MGARASLPACSTTVRVQCFGSRAVKILYVADLHYSLKQFDWLLANARPFDVAAIGGDLLDVAGALDPDVQIAVIERYLRRLRGQTRLLVVSGNHDADARNAAGEWFAKWLLRVRGDGLFVDGDEISLPNATITLCPWWDGPVSRAELEQFLAQAATRVIGKWIWIHHAPPDRSPVSWTGKKFAGDGYLLEWIRRFRPDFVLSGHIHNAPFYSEGSWIDRIENTWVFNPGRQIGQRPTSIVFDLEAMTAEWFSLEGACLKRLVIETGETSAPVASAVDA